MHASPITWRWQGRRVGRLRVMIRWLQGGCSSPRSAEARRVHINPPGSTKVHKTAPANKNPQPAVPDFSFPPFHHFHHSYHPPSVALNSHNPTPTSHLRTSLLSPRNTNSITTTNILKPHPLALATVDDVENTTAHNQHILYLCFRDQT